MQVVDNQIKNILPRQATAITSAPIGEIVLRFNFDPGQATVVYTIEKKPFIVPDNQIWDGVQDSTNGCS
ncbi:hypothetical protein [Chitinophaga silvisoli]|uniref:Uncharacterized protein n=1 Tax=Chitinophaga silvisoli TaxID=2291814 RepID=A0A3E1NZU1_9BACT|nr:hypothetical protein [Chitinophaga silvisoli]RFM33461.1 hypothetical protein DXN04_15990 [Chitinophaga silvisoli]